MDLDRIKHIHMIGIGGAGMSALAKILADKGIRITGSDIKKNRLMDQLKNSGCQIRIGHRKIDGMPQLVVRSFCIRNNNPEIIEAKKRNIPILKRSALLKKLFDLKTRSIAITGTHGKTTTTAMISYLFDKAGLDPTILIGGELDYFGGNAKNGKSDILISEVDESDGYFPRILSQNIIITNIEKEHMEYYKTMKNLLKAYNNFIHRKRKGIVFYNKDDKNIRQLIRGYEGRLMSFGFKQNCDFHPAFIKEKNLSSEFTCFNRTKKLGKVILNIPGRHNILNAISAISCGLEFGLSFERIVNILKTFKGVKRRFEIKSKIKDIVLVEDYAHHPTEIKTVLDIASKFKKRRIITIFQPHRYSRTVYLEKEFRGAFHGADLLILTDIFAASENPIKDVDITRIYNVIKKDELKQIKILPKYEIATYLKNVIKPRDMILVLGAGDINEIIPDIKKILKRKN